MTDEPNAMLLMKALIGKMESMDAELNMLRKQVSNPQAMLRKSGFVKAITPASEDVWGDPLRGDGAIVKGADDDSFFEVPENNQDYYEMDWSEIHDLANQAKSLGHVSNAPMPEANV